jgi:trimethylamine---corrinoid protein Co-methyltransferase
MRLSQVLGTGGTEQIMTATERILENTGLKIEHEAVREKLLAAGAKPGSDSEIIRFPAAMVREYLALAPSSVNLPGRTSDCGALGGGNNPVFWTAAAMNLATADGRREFERADLARLSRLVDVLPNVDGVVGVSVKDAPPKYRDVAGFREMIANTGKHVRILSFTPAGVEAILEMSAVVLDGVKLADRPVFSMGFTAHGPLRWTNLALDIYYTSAGHGIPVMVNGEPMAGGTGPVTLAGAATVGNAEIIGGIVLNQVIEPGRPCIHNLGFAHAMDMRTGTAITGAPENCLLAAAGAELARSYNLPSASWISSDAMLTDTQSASEKTMAAIAHAGAGVDLIWGVGTLESELCIGLGQAVLDDEIIGQARRLLRGIEVTEDTIAADLIEDVGPCGTFLDREHTMLNFQGEIRESPLFCRKQRENWEADGALPLQEAAEIRAQELIEAAGPPMLLEEQTRELDRIEQWSFDSIVNG